MAYQSGDGVVAEDRHVRESFVGATGSGVISRGRGRGTQEEGPFLIRMRFAEVNAERSGSFVIERASLFRIVSWMFTYFIISS